MAVVHEGGQGYRITKAIENGPWGWRAQAFISACKELGITTTTGQRRRDMYRVILDQFRAGILNDDRENFFQRVRDKVRDPAPSPIYDFDDEGVPEDDARKFNQEVEEWEKQNNNGRRMLMRFDV